MANGGAGALGFGGGLAKGLASALLQNRERQDRLAAQEAEAKFRQFSALNPVAFQAAQDTGDWATYENFLTGYFPDLAKQAKKTGFSFQDLGPLLSVPGLQPPTQVGAGQTPAAAAVTTGAPAATPPALPPGVAPPAGPMVTPETGAPAAPATPPLLPSAPAVAPATPPAVDPRSSFLGFQMLSPEQRAEQAGTVAATQQMATARVMRRAVDALVAEGIPRREAMTMVGITPAAPINVPAGGTLADPYTLEPVLTTEKPETEVNWQRIEGVLTGESEPRIFFQHPRTRQILDQAGNPVQGEVRPTGPQRDPLAQELARIRVADAQRGAAQAEAFREIPTEWRTTINRAVPATGVPPARRAAFREDITDLWATGDLKAVGSAIQQAAIESENVDTQRMIEGRRDAVVALEGIEQTMEALQASGVRTNLLRGKIEDVAQRLGTTSDPRLAALGTRLNELLFEYRRAMTGVQFSFRESQQYETMFPNYRSSLELNKARLQGLRIGMETRQRSFWEQKLGKEGAALIGAIPDPAGLR